MASKKIQDFLDLMAPLAVADMKKSGVLASVTIAQGILESGWGILELAANANNFFGMKAELSGNNWPGSTWNGDIYKKKTAEQREDGSYYEILADFRKYQDAAQAVADHSAYLTGALDENGNLRYPGLKGEKDARTAFTIIKNGGYATSLDYVEKLMQRVDKYNLTQYDNVESEGESMKEVKIMLDAGHSGKYNRSPANGAYYESDFAFKFTNMLKSELEASGFIVGVTREDQAKDLALQSRGKAAAGYDLFVSIHSNAVGSSVNNSVDYPVAITMVDDARVTIDEESKAVGEILAQVVAEVMRTNQAARTYTRQSANDRDGNGIKDDEYYGVLHGAKLVGVPGIILEHSFHTNTQATNWLLNNDNLRTMAAAEAAALAEYYGMKKQEAQDEQKQPEQEAVTWYRVRTSWDNAASQIGAYRVKDNAIKNCPEGYTVYGDNGAVIYTNSKEDKAANKLYRVRKEWKDAESQLGAYRVYDNAVRNCPEGYAVFDDNGTALYRLAPKREYIVQKGDTLLIIAKRYATSVDKIVNANISKYPKITANYIRVGWVLTIV